MHQNSSNESNQKQKNSNKEKDCTVEKECKEESGLSEIVKKEIKCANIEYRKTDWKTIQSEFNIKFRLNRNIKSIQEKYNKYLKDDVYISDSEGKRRSYPFTDKHVELILSAKIEELGKQPWKLLSDEINKYLHPSEVKCTPNQ
ncbi:13638_t:CDS:2, partial [Acaulospora morrowiae]